MSDEGMVTMDEDEEIGQVSFVDYICVLCFSLPFDRRDGGEMIDHHIISSSFVIVIAGGFYRALLCELPNHSKLFFCPCMREERERERRLLSLSLVEREDDDQSYERRRLSLSECVSLLFFFVLPLSLSLSLSLSGERITCWIAT